MNNSNTGQQLRYLEEISISLHRAGFETLPLEGEQLPVLWNGAPLCRITGKGSVFYRREDADTPQAEDALYRVEDIAAKTLEYMTTMESAPQLKASGLDGDYRILADFGGTVLAGTPSKHGVQLTEIYRCCADSVDGEFFELTDKQEEVIRSVQQQIEVCVPDLNERIRQQEEALERVSQEQTM